MSMPLKTLLFLLGVFWSFSLFGQSPVETYDSSKAYSIGALVLVGEESYIATAASTGKNPPDNTDVWTNLSVAASALGTPVEQVPNLSTSEILNSLPGSTPPGSDGNSSSFYGLAIRAYVGEFPVAGGIIINGTESKKVMIRVKGPSMNFSGSKLSDPKISITKQNSEGVYEAFLDSDDFGDHSSATTYSSYSTGNSKEPAVVVDMAPGTYGVRVEDAGGSAGNANVEFYEVDGDTSTSRFYGLAIRAYVGEFPAAGGIIISGTESKKVMIRVKGPSMNFSGSKLSDPKISITKQNSEGVYEAFLDSDDFGDHSSATTYPSYSTGNSKEPAVVVDMAPGTYGVRVEDAGGSAGNANVEFYEVE